MGCTRAAQRIVLAILTIGILIALALALHFLSEFAHAIHHFAHGLILLLKRFTLVIPTQ